jgi:hypothetical protein
MAKTAVAVKEDAKLPVSFAGFEEFAGAGFQEVTSEDLSVPFLRILAQLSPQVNKRDGAYIDGAEAGMIYNTVANEVYNGEDGILVVPCYYNLRYVEWKPREKGGGYVGSYDSNHKIVDTTYKDDRSGKDILPNGNVLEKTAQFFVLMLHPEMGPQRCLITMTASQLKKARKWVTQMQSLTAKGERGIYVLPMMSQIYRVKSVSEQNDKGNWFGWDVSRLRQLDMKSDEADAYYMGMAFSESIRAGDVKVKEGNSTEQSSAPRHTDLHSDDIPF